MLQFVVWTALEEVGFGASLQHYGALIEEEVRQRWSLPEKLEPYCANAFWQARGQAGRKRIPVSRRPGAILQLEYRELLTYSHLMLKWPFFRGTSGGERAILALAGKMLLQGEIVLVFQFYNYC